MKKSFGRLTLEVFVDLGVTVAYAVLVGILIVAVVAADDGPISFLRAGFYVLALPAGVLTLIGAEIGLRTFQEWRSGKSARGFSASEVEPA